MARENIPNTTTAVRRGLSKEALNLWAECKVCFFSDIKIADLFTAREEGEWALKRSFLLECFVCFKGFKNVMLTSCNLACVTN